VLDVFCFPTSFSSYLASNRTSDPCARLLRPSVPRRKGASSDTGSLASFFQSCEKGRSSLPPFPISRSDVPNKYKPPLPVFAKHPARLFAPFVNLSVSVRPLAALHDIHTRPNLQVLLHLSGFFFLRHPPHPSQTCPLIWDSTAHTLPSPRSSSGIPLLPPLGSKRVLRRAAQRLHYLAYRQMVSGT